MLASFQELSKRRSSADPGRIQPRTPIFTGQNGAWVCFPHIFASSSECKSQMKTDDFVSPDLQPSVWGLLDPKNGSIADPASDPSSPNRPGTLVVTSPGGFRVCILQELSKCGSTRVRGAEPSHNPNFHRSEWRSGLLLSKLLNKANPGGPRTQRGTHI